MTVIRIDELATALGATVPELLGLVAVGDSVHVPVDSPNLASQVDSLSASHEVANELAVEWMESKSGIGNGLSKSSTESLERLIALARNYERSAAICYLDQRENIGRYVDRVDAELMKRDDVSNVRRLEVLLVASEDDFNGAISPHHDVYAQWLDDAGVRAPATSDSEGRTC